MFQELLEILRQFGAGGGPDPGNNAVRFLLAAFFWMVLAWVSAVQYRNAREKRDLYVALASLIGLARELLMFLLEYGAYRGFFPAPLSFRIFPPLEHALTDIGRTFLCFAFLNYLLPGNKIGRYLGYGGLAAFTALYLVTGPGWPAYLDAHPEVIAGGHARFGLYWGDMAFRISASLLLGVTLAALAYTRRAGKEVTFFLFAAFLFLFLDEFLMIFNLATGDEPYRDILAPIRHNLSIWAIPLLVSGYWIELFRHLNDEKTKTEGILEAVGDGIVIEDLDRRIVYQNAAHRALFGGRAGERNQDGSGDLPLSGGERKLAQGIALTPEGPRDLETSSAPLRDSEGVLTSRISVVRDVTERNRMEKAARENRERYQSLVENVDFGITLIDGDHRVVMANAYLGKIFGRPVESFLGKPCYREFERREKVCEHCPGVSAMATGLPASAEVENSLPDGRTVTVRIQAFPVKNECGVSQGFIELVEDITALKQGEEERRRLEEKLLQNQKLESLGILAGGIAHDFNNLLMGIVGNVDLAMTKSPPESPVRPYLQRIDLAAQRAADLTNQMLAYSGKGRFVVEPINLSRLVEEMLHLLETVVTKRAILKFNLAEGLPPVEADATQMRQVIMNLITNASDAIGNRSGVITVTTGILEADADYLASTHFDTDLAEGFYIFLEVADTGCGMDRETQRRIFDPFFTTKHTGRGLGLAAVQGIVRGHNGALKVYSEPSCGTTFKILLPAKNLPQTLAEPKPQALSDGLRLAAEGRTILLVDDDETVRATCKMMLEECGFDVITAPDGVEGVALFRENQDRVALVLLDLVMPRMEGDEAFRQIRTIRADIPVILASGYNEQDTVSRFAGKGLAGFIQKPYRLSDLIPKIEEILSKTS